MAIVGREVTDCSRGSMIVRNAQQMKSIREAAQVAATVLDKMCALVTPGMNTYDLIRRGVALSMNWKLRALAPSTKSARGFIPPTLVCQ